MIPGGEDTIIVIVYTYTILLSSKFHPAFLRYFFSQKLCLEISFNLNFRQFPTEVVAQG